MIKSENIKVCVFDAYGTLFDINSAVNKHIEKLGENSEAVSSIWRQKQLEYSWLRSLMCQYTDFWKVTQEALDYALNSCGIENNKLRGELLDAYMHLDCYPEVEEVLKDLKEKGIVTAILSNGSPEMLKAAISSAKLTDYIDVVLCVDDIKVYKPDPKVYKLVTDKFNISKEEVLFHSSNSWDVAGASSFGFQVAWINRLDKQKETLPFKPDMEAKSLNEVSKVFK
ncbi:haloacid dehalogenase type II [Clostridium vincentii]|uniref:(S)-2-haloacid dehalogenase 4A n=1 Tax=Clostridium vincentii TaxID=52704 RepID=A0A2T0B4X7_9CLOT|nr:haloacid dehalogenase type II [Clostridium vincentii]PRR78948.1 (S)-2-haloacid dehalogenase 4A [Clostridium vincentii]